MQEECRDLVLEAVKRRDDVEGFWGWEMFGGLLLWLRSSCLQET